MARQDIAMNAVYGELDTTNNLSGKSFYEFMLLDALEGLDNDNYLYGEIVVPLNFESRYREQAGIHVRIPYTPEYKELVVRFRMDNLNGDTEYLSNRTNNKVWFPIYGEVESGEQIPIRISQFRAVNENYTYNLIMRNGYLAIFSGEQTDMQIKPSLSQNELFLLKAFAGNLYQFPTTGVGLIEYLHGNFENTGLATKLQSEFDADKMIINNAYMDSATGELYLDVQERNG